MLYCTGVRVNLSAVEAMLKQRPGVIDTAAKAWAQPADRGDVVFNQSVSYICCPGANRLPLSTRLSVMYTGIHLALPDPLDLTLHLPSPHLGFTQAN